MGTLEKRQSVERCPLEQVIQKIYETGTVIGRSGKVHKLHSSIDAQEGGLLVDLIREDVTVVRTLEVGCAYGLSSLYICSAIQGRAGATHTIIDPFQTSEWDDVGIRNLEEAGFDFFHLIQVKSEFALPRLLEEGEGQFDLVFIDGMHTFDHALLDCFYGTRLLRVGGYLTIDDVQLPSVRGVVDYLQTYPCYEVCGAVEDDSTKSWAKSIAGTLMSIVPRATWRRLLRSSVYQRIFEPQLTRMITLRKVKEDSRSWDWHNEMS